MGRVRGLTASAVLLLTVLLTSLVVGSGTSPAPTTAQAPASSLAPVVAGASTTVVGSFAQAATSSGGAYRVVGLGDSVPAGRTCRCASYVTLVAQGMGARTHQVAILHNHASGGMTTAGVVAGLHDATLRTQIADAALVIITVGANDFDTSVLTSRSCRPDPASTCYRRTIAAQRARLASVIAQVRALQTAPGAQQGRTLVTGYWNVFLDGQVARERGTAYVRASVALTLADNAVIDEIASAHGARYVDVFAPFKGRGGSDDTRLLMPDGDHPNAVGHRLLARSLLNALPA